MNRSIAARVIPFGVFIAFIALDPVLAPAAAALALDPRWLYGIRCVIVAGLLAWFWPEYSELRAPPAPVAPLWWVLAGVLGAAVIVAWVALDFPPFSFSGGAGYGPTDADGTIRWDLALTRAAGSALVVPVMEELFWRSFLTRWLERQDFLKVDPRQIGIKALALGALFFGFEHYQWFAGILAGLAYGWLYVRTGNLWTAVLAHALSNALLAGWVLQTGAWSFW